MEPSISLWRELHSLTKLGQNKTSSLKCGCLSIISSWRALPSWTRSPRCICFTTVFTKHSDKIICFRKWKAVRKVSAWVKHWGNRMLLLHTDFCFPQLYMDRNLVVETGLRHKFLSSETSFLESLLCRMKKQQYEIIWSWYYYIFQLSCHLNKNKSKLTKKKSHKKTPQQKPPKPPTPPT